MTGLIEKSIAQSGKSIALTDFTTGLIGKSIAQSEKSIGLTDFTTALTGCGKKLQAGNPSCSGGL